MAYSESNQIKILGNKIHCFESYRSFYEVVVERVTSNPQFQGYVTVNNVHTMIEGYRNPSYQAIINEGFFSIPDGKPLEIVGKLKGSQTISRLFGPTLMEHFIDWGRKDNLCHFFLGSSPETLQKLKQEIIKKYPGVKIAGMVSPPYKPLNEWDHDELIQQINAGKPDLVWIGLGAPKQERWMHQHYRNVDQGLLIGIGAGFDYLAGNTQHAPEWMKKYALEWLYRLKQEPRRLWKRYFKTIPQFLFLISLELMRGKSQQK